MGGVQTYGGMWIYRRHTDTPYADNPHMPASIVGKTSLFKAKFLHLKGWKHREPPDHTGNEPSLDIPMGGYGQDIKKNQNDKYMPFASVATFFFVCIFPFLNEALRVPNYVGSPLT